MSDSSAIKQPVSEGKDTAGAKSSADFHQQRGVAWDIIDEALNTYNSWMLDDDFDANRILREIMEKMRSRRDSYLAPAVKP